MMVKYTVQRLLALIPALLGVTLLTFAIVRVTPGDPRGSDARTARHAAADG
jgi:ABC-type dipeptide/oligopeptide/nickel transport system permease component